MAYHVTNFGSFSGNLKRYADTRGFIPEPGDKIDEMAYPGDWDFTEEEWEEFVAEAAAATRRAQVELDAWREQN